MGPPPVSLARCFMLRSRNAMKKKMMMKSQKTHAGSVPPANTGAAQPQEGSECPPQGMGRGQDPFRKGGLSRTPPGRQLLAAMTGDSVADITGDGTANYDTDAALEDAPRSSTPLQDMEGERAPERRKRKGHKRLRRSSHSRDEHSLCESSVEPEPLRPDCAVPGFYLEIHKLLTKVKELRTATQAVPNTQRDIKVRIDNLFFQVSGYARKADAARAEKALVQSVGAQTEGAAAGETRTRSVGTQTLDEGRPETAVAVAEEIRREISRAEQDPEALEATLARTWPAEAYTNTTLVRESIGAVRGVRAILVADGNQKDLERVSLLGKQFAGLDQALVDSLRPGGVAILRQASSIVIDGGDEEENGQPAPSRTLIVGRLSDDTPGGSVQGTIALLSRVIRRADGHGGEGLMIQFSDSQDLDRTRRVLECVTDGNPKVEICSKGKKTSGNTGGARVEEGRSLDAGTVLLKHGGVSFADTVRGLKARLNPEKDGVTLQSVSITQQGEVKLQIKETRAGGRDAFSKTLQATASALSVEVKDITRTIPVALRGLDASVDMEEVKAALVKVGVELKPPLAIRLGEPTENRSGYRTAIVRVPRAEGRRLLAMKTMEVGWSKCRARITDWDQPQCCYNCQQFGHTAAGCKASKETRRRCYRCGGEDHLAKGCKSEPMCYACGAKGHRADSDKCPKHQRLRKPAAKKGKPEPARPTAPKNSRKRRRAMEVKDFGEATAQEQQEEAAETTRKDGPDEGSAMQQ